MADLLFLRYHGNEIDDGVSVVGGPAAATQARLDQFVNGENIDGTDVVVWCAGHFLHDEEAPGRAAVVIEGVPCMSGRPRSPQSLGAWPPPWPIAA